MAVYTYTLLPGLGHSGDTAKFQFIGRVLGTPHSTGYPTYLMLNHAFTGLFPWGSLAWKSNLLSAVFATFACLVLFRILIVLSVRSSVATVTSLTFGLTRTFWSQAVIAEVYTLNALFVALVVLCLVQWSGRPDKLTTFRLAALTYALSFGNHMTMITLLPAILVFVFTVDRRIYTNARLILFVIACVAAGAAQYLYFFWRQHAVPPAPMEMTAPDFVTFWRYATGAQFRHRMFSQPLSDVISIRVPLILGLIRQELGWLLLLVPVGAAVLFDRRILLLLGLGFAGLFFFVVNYLIPDIVTYLMPASLFLCITVGLGMEWLLGRLQKWRRRFPSATFGIIPLILLVGNYQHANQRDNVFEARRTEDTLARVGHHAVIIAPDYHHGYYFRYYLIGEGKQRDDIYLVLRFDPRDIAAYVHRTGDLTIPFQRLTVPPDLAVYVLDATQADRLREYGVSARLIGTDLFMLSVADTVPRNDLETPLPVSDAGVALPVVPGTGGFPAAGTGRVRPGNAPRGPGPRPSARVTLRTGSSFMTGVP